MDKNLTFTLLRAELQNIIEIIEAGDSHASTACVIEDDGYPQNIKEKKMMVEELDMYINKRKLASDADFDKIKKYIEYAQKEEKCLKSKE